MLSVAIYSNFFSNRLIIVLISESVAVKFHVDDSVHLFFASSYLHD